MKISKKQLKQIINEELEAIKENVRPDVDRLQKKMSQRGISDLVASKINTWQELQGLLAGIIQQAPVKDNQKLQVLRKLIASLSGGGAAPPQDAQAEAPMQEEDSK